ncbi:MAG TPA: hypothetical protein VGK96_28595 [Candidatus Sulfotelmatobacter sp.]|jgi:hypothetical protein
MSSTPYIPTKKSLLMAWATNFGTLFTASPTTYGFTSADAATVAAANATMQAAYTVANTAATRSKPNVANMDAAIASYLATVRPYAVAISLNKGVSNDQKASIGVTVRGTGPTPVPVPSTSPVLTTIAGTPGQQTVRYADQNTPSARKKPFGAIAIQLYCSASATVISDPTMLQFVNTFTKNPVGLPTPSGGAGKICYMAGRWVTRTGLVGPWSSIVTFTGT